MTRGFVVDHNMGAATVGLWVEGEPVHTVWGGGVRAPREHSIPVATFRCVGCGFLLCTAGVRGEALVRPDPSLQPKCYLIR